MQTPWVTNVSLREAMQLVGTQNCVLIAITDPSVGALEYPGVYHDTLRLQFHDIDDIIVKLLDKNPNATIMGVSPDKPVIFSESQAKTLAAFLKLHRGKNILAHCHAGVCRSGAVVEAVLAAFPEYLDKVNRRVPNTLVKHTLLAALGFQNNGSTFLPS